MALPELCSGDGVLCTGDCESMVVPGTPVDSGYSPESSLGPADERVVCSGELESMVVPGAEDGPSCERVTEPDSVVCSGELEPMVVPVADAGVPTAEVCDDEAPWSSVQVSVLEGLSSSELSPADDEAGPAVPVEDDGWGTVMRVVTTPPEPEGAEPVPDAVGNGAPDEPVPNGGLLDPVPDAEPEGRGPAGERRVVCSGDELSISVEKVDEGPAALESQP